MSRTPKIIEVGTVPCVTCQRPHDYRRTGTRDALGRYTATWASSVDGHSYVRMSAEQVVVFLGAQRSVTVLTVGNDPVTPP